tara:strand:+ start:704 stop:1480 length:777 start_codon:yes stop_codon:yes gene_type:complete
MKNPIGIFDSGIGGISILEKLKQLLPNENFIYLADNQNCPYGSKSKKEIISLSNKNCEKLIELNCKIIIIACNTSTTNSIKKLREIIAIPIIGIEPGLKPAIHYTKTKNIGILATEKTLGSKLFFETLNQNRIDDIHIHEQIGYELVNLIEEGSHSKQNIYKILEKYLVPMINKKIDCLLLGCTHYNHVKDIIEEIIPEDIKIVDTIAPVNNRVLNILKSNNILNKSTNKRTIKIFYNGKKLSSNYLDKEYDLRYLEF